MLSGLDHQNLAAKEKAKVDLEVREKQNYTNKKMPKKHEMWWIYGILIFVVLMIISFFIN